ncbi:MAG: periplasmic heavy metal sensor [Sphingobacteriales bacterium]|nr:periplasmic heavy metal sensor [Sphingobacteriales bacterium]MBI3718647.1 periplasmic heavy metal sensor [Sphingobacteriales bacterium]
MAKSRSKIYLIIISLLLIINIALVWFFVISKPARPDDGRLGITEMLKNEVGFDEAQMKQALEMKKRHREKIKPYFDEVRKAKESFYVLLQNPQVSDSVRKAAAAVIGQKQEELDMAIFSNFNEIRQLCKPDQLIKFDSSMQQIVKHMIANPRRGRQPETKDSTNKNN